MTEEQRIHLVAAIVAAIVKRGEIFEDQMLQARDEFMAASNQCLADVAGDLQVVGF